MSAPTERAPAAFRASRLELTRWCPGDLEDLHRAVLRSLDSLRPWVPWSAGEPRDLEARRERLKVAVEDFEAGRIYTYAARQCRGGALVGEVGLYRPEDRDTFEVGYWVDAEHQRRGYATEMVVAMTEVGLVGMGLEELLLHTDPENLPSGRVAARAGFELRETRRDAFRDPWGRQRDRCVWSRRAEDLDPGAG